MNPWRGDAAIEIDGQRRRMRLTLGALAELEAGLGSSSLLDLVERFEAGRFSAADLLALIGAGLAGAGEPVSAEELSRAQIEGGAMGAARAAADLLRATFH